MKKYLTILLLFIFAAVVYAENESFYDALQNCSPYSSNGAFNHINSGKNIQIHILGMENDKCVYQEKIIDLELSSCMTCRLTQKQIDRLVRVQHKYSNVWEYPYKETFVYDPDNVQTDPVMELWNKYITDSSICNIEMSE